MDFHKIWQEQCEATRTIRERFGVENALDYLIGEKLLIFARQPTRTQSSLPSSRSFKRRCGRFSTPMNSAAIWPALNLPPERSSRSSFTFLRKRLRFLCPTSHLSGSSSSRRWYG